MDINAAVTGYLLAYHRHDAELMRHELVRARV